MKVLQVKYIFLSIFLRLNGMFQTILIFTLFPIYLTKDYVAAPIISNTAHLWAWNIPTENCSHKHDVPIDLSFYSFVGSSHKDINGQNVTLFHADRLGLYPYIDMHNKKDVNGGIPQLGDLKAHLKQARKDITYSIPTDYVSLAIIDWQEWRPLWERNWGLKYIYKFKSIELVMKTNQNLNLSSATIEAKSDFENKAKDFMMQTLKLGKSLRPNSYWGYYQFPDFYNHLLMENEYNASCLDEEKRRNDNLNWLWTESSALYTSIYLNANFMSNPLAALLVRNRVQEAVRVSKVRNIQNPLPVFVYVSPVFTDAPGEFLSEVDLVNTVGESIALGVSGIILWGSLNFSNSKQSCMNLSNYLDTVFNPYLLNVTLAAKLCSQVLCQDQGICVRKSWNSTDYLHLNPKNFKIQIGQYKRYNVNGKPTAQDLDEFATKFKCKCYSYKKCRIRSSKLNIDHINVCFANICISSCKKPED